MEESGATNRAGEMPLTLMLVVRQLLILLRHVGIIAATVDLISENFVDAYVQKIDTRCCYNGVVHEYCRSRFLNPTVG